MKKSFVSFALACIFLASCNKEEVISVEVPLECAEVECESGHLNFATTRAFEEHIAGIAWNVSGYATKSSSRLSIPAEFVSIADRKRNLALTKSSSSGEMSPEEYEIMLAESLLVDPVLTEVLDTDLTIGVEDRIYKITEYGTFSIEVSEAEQLPGVIRNFDKSRADFLENGESIRLGGSAIFTNTFGESHSPEKESAILSKALETKAARQSSVFVNDFHRGYGTVDYEWKNRSLWQKFWDMIRGRKVFRENEFDDTHRVQVSLYDVNYLFYASAGLKCEMQSCRPCRVGKRWVPCNAEDIAIGFNKVYGRMKFNNPRNYSEISPTSSGYWSKFTGRIDGVTSDFIHGIMKLDVLRDWANEKIFVCIPSFDMAGKTFTNTEIGNRLFYAAEDKVLDFLKSQAGKHSVDLETGIRRRIQPEDPRAAYFVWGESTVVYNEEKPFVMGVRHFGSGSSKTATFDTSFGFSINISNGKADTPRGFLPTEFDIDEIDAFGAVKYGGKWKGVRFTTDK